MKLRVFDGCHEVSHAGRAIEISEDGSVEVESDAQEALISHGFNTWEDIRDGSNNDAMTRDRLISPEAHIALRTVETIGTGEIHTMVAATELSTPPDGSKALAASIAITDIVG